MSLFVEVPGQLCFTLFPYTTLFRSHVEGAVAVRHQRETVRPLGAIRQQQQLTLQGAELSRRSEEHTSELQSLRHLECRLLLEKIEIRIIERGVCAMNPL